MKPAWAALATLSALSSPAITSAPPAFSAWQEASPEPPRPNTATVLPAKDVTGIMIGPLSFRGSRSENPESRDSGFDAHASPRKDGKFDSPKPSSPQLQRGQ